MTLRRSLAVMATLFASALAACTGGSGSSGFDALSEDVAIARALAVHRCVMREGLTICPTDTAMSGPQTPGSQGGRVDVALTDATTSCNVNPTDGCTFNLPFSVSGFAATARFHVAVRGIEPNQPWTVGPELMAGSQQAMAAFDTPVAVEGGPSAPSAPGHAQIAVLVFLEPRAPIPAEVRELAETAADLAFVSEELTLLAVSRPSS